MALRESDNKNYNTLSEAFENEDTCLLECTEKATGEQRAVICAIQKVAPGQIEMVPLAVMITGNPYEMFYPPAHEDDGKEDSRTEKP